MVRRALSVAVASAAIYLVLPKQDAPHRAVRHDTAPGGLTAFSLLGVGGLLAARRATEASPQPSLVLLAHAAVGIIALFPVTPGRAGQSLLPAAPGARGP